MSDLIETIARAIWDKKTDADYPWWHVDPHQCQLARDLARAALCALTQYARGHRDFADLGDGWVLTKAHGERPPLTDREVTDFKASVLSSATHLLESEGFAVVPTNDAHWTVGDMDVVDWITSIANYPELSEHRFPLLTMVNEIKRIRTLLSGRPKVTEQ